LFFRIIFIGYYRSNYGGTVRRQPIIKKDLFVLLGAPYVNMWQNKQKSTSHISQIP